MLAGALFWKAMLSWQLRPDAFWADDVKATGYTVMNTLAPSTPPVLDALQDTKFKYTAATSSFNNEQPVTAYFGDFICTNFVSLLESFSLLLMTMVTLAEPWGLFSLHSIFYSYLFISIVCVLLFYMTVYGCYFWQLRILISLQQLFLCKDQ